MTGSSRAGGALSPAYTAPRGRKRSRIVSLTLAARFGGAVALLVTGAVHLQQFAADQYSQIPTIGTLFLLNFAGATVLALALLAPLERIGRRLGSAAVTLSALAGIALAATSIAFLLISEHQQLFGFREAGYRTVIVIALLAEGAAVTLLAGFLAARAAGSAPDW